MKATDRYAAIAMVLGIASGLATAFWLLPEFVWWAHVVIGVIVTASLYQGMVQQKGAENLADMEIRTPTAAVRGSDDAAPAPPQPMSFPVRGDAVVNYRPLSFLVQGSAATPYTVTFTRDGDNLTALCTCKAGRFGQACKHRLALLRGEVTDLVSDNADDVVLLKSWLAGTDVEAGLAELDVAEQSPWATAKAKISTAKKALSGAMKD